MTRIRSMHVLPFIVLFILSFIFVANYEHPSPIELQVNPDSIFSESSENNNMNSTKLSRHHASMNIKDYSMLTLWSSDFHISPIADIKALLEPLGVKIIDKSLSGHCHLTNTCQKNLRVINRDNGIDLGNCPNELRRKFYNSYRDDKEFLSVDAIICTHASSMCELFMPFNKTLIVIASTRYEIGRYQSATPWLQWNRNLALIASKPFNVIGANNRYDQEYMHYFTNLGAKIRLMPSFCGYITERYNPTRSEVLIAPARGVHRKLSQAIFAELYKYMREKATNFKENSRNETRPHRLRSLLTISHIRDLYPNHYEYSDIASHPAIIILPYQISFMSFFEFYRMGIPMFAPSIDLLTEWHLQDAVISERTWDRVFGHPGSKSLISRHPSLNTSNILTSSHTSQGLNPYPYSSSTERSAQYDPNNEYSKDAIGNWLSYSDFYTWPHITVFISWRHLFELLDEILGTSSDQSKPSAESSSNEIRKLAAHETLEDIFNDSQAMDEGSTHNKYDSRIGERDSKSGDAVIGVEINHETELAIDNSRLDQEIADNAIKKRKLSSDSTGTAKLFEISGKMMNFNSKEAEYIQNQWMDILDGIKKAKDMKQSRQNSYSFHSKRDSASDLPTDINDALVKSYGYKLSSECDGQIYL